MLVVIAIIAILASLLMSSLQSALGTARTVICSGNMRQLGVVAGMYSDEYNNRLPPVICLNSYDDFKCIRYGGGYGDYGSFITYIQGYYLQNPISKWGNASITRDPIFMCPSDQSPNRNPSISKDGRCVSYQANSTVWGYINDRDGTYGSNTVSQGKFLVLSKDIAHPSKTQLLADAPSVGNGTVRDAAFPPHTLTEALTLPITVLNGNPAWKALRMSHGNEDSCNILYFDTHVSPLIYPDLPENLTRTWIVGN